MARPLHIAHAENATIEELKQVSREGSNETATRCSAIQMVLSGADRQPIGTTGNRCTCRRIRPNLILSPDLNPLSPDLNPIEGIWLTIKARWLNNYV